MSTSLDRTPFRYRMWLQSICQLKRNHHIGRSLLTWACFSPSYIISLSVLELIKIDRSSRRVYLALREKEKGGETPTKAAPMAVLRSQVWFISSGARPNRKSCKTPTRQISTITIKRFHMRPLTCTTTWRTNLTNTSCGWTLVK